MADTWSKRKSRRMARRRVVILISRATAFATMGLGGLSILLYLLFPVEEVRVEGNEMLPKSAILENIPERTSLPMIWARSLEGQVKANLWVEGVNVNRGWDSGMVVVEVEEKDAVLNASLDNGERVVLAEDGSMLPGLGGATLAKIDIDRMRLEEIQDVQRVLEENGVEVESVNSVGANGVEVSLRNPEGSDARALYAGKVGGGQVRVLKGLLRERPEVQYFDLRSPGRVVVGETKAQGGDTARSSG